VCQDLPALRPGTEPANLFMQCDQEDCSEAHLPVGHPAVLQGAPLMGMMTKAEISIIPEETVDERRKTVLRSSPGLSWLANNNRRSTTAR
jgi:hypothetical protein